MARRPKPWFRKDRNAWFVTINGERHNLSPDKAEAFELFYKLMRQPAKKKVSQETFVSIADAFLDWTLRNRSEATFIWYRDHLCFVSPQLRLSGSVTRDGLGVG